MHKLLRRALSVLTWPPRRMRDFVTQRVENVLRQEIRNLHQRISAFHDEFDTAIRMRDERIRALEIVVADSHPWKAPKTPSGNVPGFSIIMPTRNRGALVVDAVQSVVAQTFGDWELLIVDDGGSDDTAERLRPFLSDPRIRLEHREHRGPSAARNAALELARAPLIAYLDSDNIWFPNYLARMKAVFDAEPDLDSAYGILVANADIHGPSRLVWEPFDFSALQRGNYIDLNVYVHRRALIERHGRFDETLDRLNDWDLVLRQTRDGNCKRVAVAAAHYRTDLHDRVSATRSFSDNWRRMARKSTADGGLLRKPKILYALWHYPQLSETYIETEIRAMLRFGANIEVWSNEDVAVRYEPAVPVRRGTLDRAIAEFAPDVIHTHWISSAITYAATALAANLPITVRSHGFELNKHTLQQLLNAPAL
ncbi:MAG: glycosyltransferase family A protein, partial [Rudaea sp.]